VDARRVGEHHRLWVTSLYPRSVPLVRYELGDEIEPWPGAGDTVPSVLSFRRVLGRCNDYVVLADGTLAHSEAFTHSVRGCAAIRAYQVVQDSAGIRLCYEASGTLDVDEERGVRQRLGRIHEELGRIPIERVTALRRTIAGKTPMVIRR
jgi:phenylacetate-coenzyme A ligase PaaK-like adenylate-forming protein